MLIYSTAVFVFLQFCLTDKVEGDLTVTVAVYSGRVDPTWSVPSSHPYYKEISGLLLTSKTYSVDAMPARLGYKGFVVLEGKKAQLIVGRETTKLQQLLLQTAKRGLLSDAVLQEIATAMNTGAAKAEIIPGKRKRYAPPYNRDLWPGLAGRLCNNCYNYANIRRTNDIAEPGLGGNQQYQHIDVASIRAAARRDGLTVANPYGLPNDPIPIVPAENPRHLVAGFVWPGEDYHWYRLDNNGMWSQKPNNVVRPTDRDNSGTAIADPRQADRGPYEEFVAFMYSNRNTVTIRGHANCCSRLMLYGLTCGLLP